MEETKRRMDSKRYEGVVRNLASILIVVCALTATIAFQSSLQPPSRESPRSDDLGVAKFLVILMPMCGLFRSIVLRKFKDSVFWLVPTLSVTYLVATDNDILAIFISVTFLIIWIVITDLSRGRGGENENEETPWYEGLHYEVPKEREYFQRRMEPEFWKTVTLSGATSTTPSSSCDKKTVTVEVEREREIRLIDEGDSEMPVDEELEERFMRDCIYYCSLFPADYEFTRDTLVWSWCAAGFVDSKQNGKMDQVAIGCFDRFIRSNYIIPFGYDQFCDQMRYKLGSDFTNISLDEQSSVIRYQKGLDSDTDVVNLEYLSMKFEGINDQTSFEILRKCSNLKTLLLQRCYSSKLERLLHDLFLELKLLKILDLSGTNIVELPSSVENLKELRYLDMSETPIRRLPDTIDSLEHLETLILLGCLSLCGLPKCMYKLVNLKHLVLDIARLLQSMPVGMGKLINLQTLGAFIVGTKEGNCIGQLRNMNHLKGSLCILNLENVPNKEEAKWALLGDKKYLTKLDFVWSDFQDARDANEEEILEYLRPNSCLQELKIVNYSGGVLPSWISDPSFSQIVSITLHGCRYCERLPSLGELPSLKRLDIVDMDSLVDIDSLFCKKRANYWIDNTRAFPQLEKMSFDGMSNLKKWTGVKDGHFPCLEQLVIKYCPKLVSLPSLSYLKSLRHLEISYCPDLPCLPKGGLPTSLKCLMFKGCPMLKDRCCKERGEDWVKVETVPSLYIDDHKVCV